MMIQKIPAKEIYTKEYTWYTAHSHFSYGDYLDPDNERFGVLQALNEFIIQPGNGFTTHPHADMEIISYCVEGELTHGDDSGNTMTLNHGDAQYLRAGSGITHSELNETQDRPLRFYQIWITPEKRGLPPKYDSRNYSKSAGNNHLQQIVSGETAQGVIHIYQDANVYVAKLERDKQLMFPIDKNRQGYLVCIQGKFLANGIELKQRDALKIWGERSMTFAALEESHFLMVEMAAES